MDEVSINAFGLGTLCRLCLSKDVTVLDIFTSSIGLIDQVADVIMKCAPVQITRCDEMPNLICQSCYTQLEKSHQFQKQVVEADKILRSYLQQLRTSNKQIKAECTVLGPPEDPLILDTNTNITIKCESLELQDMKEEVPANYTSAYEINEEMSLKSEFKEAPTENSSLIPTEYSDKIDTLSQGDNGVEISCENSEIEKQSEKLTGLRFADVTENFAKRGNKKTSSKHKKHDKSNKMKYKCDRCNKCFNYLSDLNNHIRTHTGENPYHCDVCNKSFNKKHFKIHQRTHTGEKPYQCDVCSKSFGRLDGLRYHQRLHHTCEEMYQCDVCNKSFGKKYFKIHQRTHTGEKPYLCNDCGKCFTDVSQLGTHKKVHTDERPYLCNECGMSFRLLGHLRRHQRVHTGEKPYQCDVCNKSFRQLVSLGVHQRVHTGEKPYQCFECDKRFSQSHHLKKHLKVHNKSMIYKCPTCDEKFKMKRDLKSHIQEVHNVPK